MDQNQMMLEYLLEMGALQPEQDAIAQKRAIVNQLRQGGQLPGISSTPGGGGGPGVYAQPQIQRAAGPLAALSTLGQQALAAYQNQQANQMQDAYGQRRRDALGALRTRMMPSGNPSSPDPNNAALPY